MVIPFPMIGYEGTLIVGLKCVVSGHQYIAVGGDVGAGAVVWVSASNSACPYAASGVPARPEYVVAHRNCRATANQCRVTTQPGLGYRSPPASSFLLRYLDSVI